MQPLSDAAERRPRPHSPHADAAIALHTAIGSRPCDAADVSNDGRVTSLDALMILQAADGAIEL